MMAFLAFWLLLQSPPVTATLTVLGGSGSGTYACGSTVTISAPSTKGSQVFAQWSTVPMGMATIDREHQRKTKVTVPCDKPLVIEAHYTQKPPKGKR